MKVLQLTQTGAIQEVQLSSTLGGVNFSRVIVPVTPVVISQNSVVLDSVAVENTVSMSIDGLNLNEGIDFAVMQNATFATSEVQFLSTLQPGGLTPLEIGDTLVIDFAIDPVIAPVAFQKLFFTITDQNVLDQFVDLPHLAQEYGLKLFIDGLQMIETLDYTLSTASGVTRISFSGDLSTSGVSAIITGDVVEIQYSVIT